MSCRAKHIQTHLDIVVPGTTVKGLWCTRKTHSLSVLISRGPGNGYWFLKISYHKNII